VEPRRSRADINQRCPTPKSRRRLDQEAPPALPPAEEEPPPPLQTGWTADGAFADEEYLGEWSDGKFEMRWRSDGQYVYMGIRAETAGWVAVGLEPTSGMKDADMIFGMVADGQTTVSDQFSTGRTGPHSPDTELGGSGDILEFAGSEAGGYTTIEFKRLLSTGDEYDNDLAPGTTAIIWSYSSADSLTQKHSARGSGEITL